RRRLRRGLELGAPQQAEGIRQYLERAALSGPPPSIEPPVAPSRPEGYHQVYGDPVGGGGINYHRRHPKSLGTEPRIPTADPLGHRQEGVESGTQSLELGLQSGDAL